MIDYAPLTERYKEDCEKRGVEPTEDGFIEWLNERSER